MYRVCGRYDLRGKSHSFLKTYPEYQKLFPSFANVPQAQLLKNGNFLAQSYTIAAGLNTIVQSLGSQELLAQEMNHLGTTHFNRGAQLHMFEVQAAYCVTSYNSLIDCFHCFGTSAIRQSVHQRFGGRIGQPLHS